MCGIYGLCSGGAALAPVLEGLSRLEYRGYDSAGVAFFTAQGAVKTLRTTERVERLKQMAAAETDGGTAIAHTRWATHGGVTLQNAHPHTVGRVTLVHNGIIENYERLRAELGYAPVSGTDTEIAAALIDGEYGADPVRALEAAAARLEGSYALAVIFSDRPGLIYAMRRESPLALMRTADGCFLSSDPATFPACGEYYVPEEGTIAELSREGVRFFGGEAKKRTLGETERNAGRAGHEHYMLKEILEEPEAFRRTVRRYVTADGRVDFSCDGVEDALLAARRVNVVACGTAMQAGMVAAHYFRRLAGVEAESYIASEFCDAGVRVDEDCLTVFVSQSGETADTLAALRAVRAQGRETLAVINRRGTVMERECGHVLRTSCGPEIAVASTKAFTAQMGVLYLLAIRMAVVSGRLDAAGERAEAAALCAAENDIRETLALRPEILRAAEEIHTARDVFFIGRAADYAVACEAALKLKEISYLHAEAIAAGELKHGTISLIEPGVPCVCFLTREETRSRALLSVQEVLSRGGRVYLFAARGLENVEQAPGLTVLRMPVQAGSGAVFAAAVCLQLMAYETAKRLGLPIDTPRNLAKSVTVA